MVKMARNAGLAQMRGHAAELRQEELEDERETHHQRLPCRQRRRERRSSRRRSRAFAARPPDIPCRGCPGPGNRPASATSAPSRAADRNLGADENASPGPMLSTGLQDFCLRDFIILAACAVASAMVLRTAESASNPTAVSCAPSSGSTAQTYFHVDAIGRQAAQDRWDPKSAGGDQFCGCAGLNSFGHDFLRPWRREI